jgi:hypothetical protein
VEHQGTDTARLDRVEHEVGAIRGEMGALTTEMGNIKADVRGLGAILSRIEVGVSKAQERADNREDRGKPNVTAVVSILISIFFTLVTGAWFVGGNLARVDERSIHQSREASRMWVEIDRAERRTRRGDYDAEGQR